MRDVKQRTFDFRLGSAIVTIMETEHPEDTAPGPETQHPRFVDNTGGFHDLELGKPWHMGGDDLQLILGEYAVTITSGIGTIVVTKESDHPPLTDSYLQSLGIETSARWHILEAARRPQPMTALTPESADGLTWPTNFGKASLR